MAFNFVNKPGYEQFMGLLFGWGAPVVILGALFKILHLPGASIMLMAGMGTEAIIFFFSAFEKPHPEYDWDRVYPVLGNKPDGTPMYPDGEGAPMPFHGGNASQNILSDKLEEMLEKANVTPAVFEKLSSGIEKLTRTTESLNSMGNVAGINQNYAAELNKMTQHLNTLNEFYTLQIQASKTQAEANAKLQSDVSKIMETMSASLQSSIKYRQEIDDLSSKVAALNKMYGQMLAAMQNAHPAAKA